METKIRFATLDDCQDILAIYGKYIEETAVSFETHVPSQADFRKRMEKIMATYPYLVCQAGDHVAGYAYASLHGERAAFCYDVDLSIYFSPSFHQKGLTKPLYTTLFALLKAQGFYNAYASYTEPNEKSRLFHSKLGFQPVGTFQKAGYKLGKWHDLTWMSLVLQDYVDQPGDITPIDQVPQEIKQKIIKNLGDSQNTE